MLYPYIQSEVKNISRAPSKFYFWVKRWLETYTRREQWVKITKYCTEISSDNKLFELTLLVIYLPPLSFLVSNLANNTTPLPTTSSPHFPIISYTQPRLRFPWRFVEMAPTIFDITWSKSFRRSLVNGFQTPSTKSITTKLYMSQIWVHVDRRTILDGDEASISPIRTV
jgi:hypothetical protein